MSYIADMRGSHTIELEDDHYDLTVIFRGRVVPATLSSPADFINFENYSFTLDGEDVTEQELVQRFGNDAKSWVDKAIQNADEVL